MARDDPHRQDRFEALWRDHAPAVLRYARRRVLPADVDEVVAETFVVVWRRLDDVPAVPLPWLLGVARGVSGNVRRSARRQDALADRVSATTPRPPGWPPAADDVVLDALAALPEDDRELLALLAWDGLSRVEAAQALGISRGTLAVRLHRARRRAQALLPAEPAAAGAAGAPAHAPLPARPEAAAPAPLIGQR